MWICKLKWKHDCIIGKRCKKFNVKVIGYPIDFYEEEMVVKGKKQKKYFYLHFEKIYGKEENIKKFFVDFKKDPKLKHLEIEGNMFFFAYEVDLYDVPTSHYAKKTFFLKPIIVDEQGYEYWEIASWNRQNLMDFIKETKEKIKGMEDFKVMKIEKSKLSDIYFPQILPDLSPGQKKALELASDEGYFNYPRKIELRDLAKISGISLSTYREHLRRAEGKLIPNLKKNI
jgi:predicted DNA binding protein